MKEINHFKVTFFIFSVFMSRIIDLPDPPRLLTTVLSRTARPYSCCLFLATALFISSWRAFIYYYLVGLSGKVSFSFSFRSWISFSFANASYFCYTVVAFYLWALRFVLRSLMRVVSTSCFSFNPMSSSSFLPCRCIAPFLS